MSVRDPYYTDFAREYDRHNSGVSGDVEFYRELAQQAGGPVVELGVGTGRVAIPVVQAGVAVLGLDLSPEMLVICREKAREARATALALAIGDMRRFALTRPAALLTIPHRAFLHNLTTDDQLATLACCRAALPRGGRLALNVFKPDLGQITDWTERGPDEWEDAPGWPSGARQRHDYDPASQRVGWTVMLPDVEGRRRRVAIRLRWVYRFEMEHLLERSGFAVEDLYGDFAGRPLGPLSTEMVWVARAT